MMFAVGMQASAAELGVGLAAGTAFGIGALWQQRQRHKALSAQRRRLTHETLAYARLDLSQPKSEREIALAACRAITQHSSFRRAAVLLADETGAFHVEASLGLDDLTLASINSWGTQEFTRLGESSSMTITLRPYNETGVMEVEAVHCCRLHLLPFCDEQGSPMGALAVSLEETQHLHGEEIPLHQLGARLCSALYAYRLQHGAGRFSVSPRAVDDQQIAQALTAMGAYAELILDRSRDERVRDDARAILQGTRQLQDTLGVPKASWSSEKQWWRKRGA